MHKLLVIVLSLLLIATPACLAKHRNAQTDNSQQTQASAQPANANAAGDSGNLSDPSAVGDVNKTLDKMLSSPAPGGAKDTPPPASTTSAMPAALPAAVPYASAQTELPIPPPSQAATALKGQARIDSSGAQAAGEPLPGELQQPLLQGQASMSGVHLQADQDDPDIGDQQLMIAWDRWRNRFLRAVQMQVQANINNPDSSYRRRRRFDPFTGAFSLPFPLGTIAWFRCKVTSDRRIEDLEIVESSGFQDYDRAVVTGIRALEGTSLLEFPAGSHRPSVHQEAGIETAAQADNRYFNFGDIERYSTPMQRGGY